MLSLGSITSSKTVIYPGSCLYQAKGVSSMNDNPMSGILGVKTFITWHPPKSEVTVGNIKLSNGSGVKVTHKTTNSSGYSQRSTVRLEYETLAPGELDMWVLFHAFILGDPLVLPSYMGTIHGVVEFLDEPFGSERDYADFLNTVYRTEGITQKMSYQELYQKFIELNEQQSGMAKNWLLDLKPGDSWSHPEMADYSYWRMVIDFSIVDAIIGRRPRRTFAEEWLKSRLREIICDPEKAEQYMKIIWTVRQNIRHNTAHQSDYPHKRPSSQLKQGDNEFDIETVVNTFKTDTHALKALETNMHDVTRILLLDNILQTKIFPDLRPYMVRTGGMTWEQLMQILKQGD